MDLEALRRVIDDADNQIADAFRQRMEAVDAIAEYKRACNLAVQDTTREDAVMARAAQRVGDPYMHETRQLYRAIFSISRKRQQGGRKAGKPDTQVLFPTTATVACAEESVADCQRLFEQPIIKLCASIGAACRVVKEGRSDFCVLPTREIARVAAEGLHIVRRTAGGLCAARQPRTYYGADIAGLWINGAVFEERPISDAALDEGLPQGVQVIGRYARV